MCGTSLSKMLQMNKLYFLYITYLIAFTDLLAIGLTFPLFSNHLRKLGASHLTVGIILSLYSGIQVLSGPLIGSWSDIRSRKFVLSVSLAVASCCYIFLGLTTSLLVIVLIRTILGIFKHTQSITRAIVTDLLPPNEHTGAFGRLAGLSSVGFIAGPILGGHLSHYEHGFSYVCILTGILFITNLGFAQLLPKTKRETKHGNNPNFFTLENLKHEITKSFRETWNINWASLWDVFLLRFIFGLVQTTYFSQQAMYLQEQFNLSPLYVGYTISYFSIIGAVSALFLDNFSNYFYKDDTDCLQRLTHSFILLTVSCMCLYSATHIALFMLFLVPFSLSSSVLRIVSMELVFKKSDEEHRGSLSGVSNSVMSVARFVTPLITGLMADTYNEHSVLLLLIILPLLGTGLSFSMKYNRNRARDQNVKIK